jgi:hypothetical protein
MSEGGNVEAYQTGLHTSPYIEGSFSERAIREAGAEILQAPQEVIAAVSDRMNEIILTEWAFPSPVGR